MTTISHKRKEAAYFRAISYVLSEEITNANISYITVTSVKLSPDSSHLFIYITFEKNADKSLEALKGISGFIRTRMATSVKQRIVPMIHFELDHTFENGKRIDEILDKINSKK